MKKIILVFLLFIPVILYSQSYSGAYFDIKYDNFTGSDATDFETDMQGFGSINSNVGFYVGKKFGEGAIQPLFDLGLGLATKIYRFKNDYVFGNQNDQLVFVPGNPTHEYSSGFFSYSKSKLYYYAVRLHLEVGFVLFDKVLLSGGPLVDTRLYIYQKNKYKIEDKFYSDELRRNKHFENDIFNIGFKGNIGFKKIGLSASYMTTPFFGGEDAPELNPIEVGFYIRTK